MPRTSNGPRDYESKNGWFATFGSDRIRLTTGRKKQTEDEATEPSTSTPLAPSAS